MPIRRFYFRKLHHQSSFAAFDHIEELFVEPTEEEGRNLLPSEKVAKPLERFESLEFKNVSFRYKDDAPYVLKNVSFVLEKGHQIALVGSTGSGKSTILRLISKTYQDTMKAAYRWMALSRRRSLVKIGTPVLDDDARCAFIRRDDCFQYITSEHLSSAEIELRRRVMFMPISLSNSCLKAMWLPTR